MFLRKRTSVQDINTANETLGLSFDYQSWTNSMMVNMVICDAKSFEIKFCNENCKTSSKKLKNVLPVTGDSFIGQNLDILFGSEGAPRDIIHNPSKLPLRTSTTIGNEILDLLIAPVKNKSGIVDELLITWHVVTEQRATRATAAKLTAMVEHMPANILFCDPNTSTINYQNTACKSHLNLIQDCLPFKIDNLIGTDASVFDNDPSALRKLLSNPRNLPATRISPNGKQTLKLHLSAITDENGLYVGNMITIENMTKQSAIVERIRAMAETVSVASGQMEQSAKHMSSTVKEVHNYAASASNSITQASGNAQTVAAAADQLTMSISDISSQVKQSTDMSRNAVTQAEHTNETVAKLSESSARIGDVVKMINDIAGQTNLLALNATIEAARAGEAGKGFAVVASEVKNLANQTANATEEITKQITEMQNSTKDAVDAIDQIKSTISDLSEVAATISDSMEEQGAATSDIAQNIANVSRDSSNVSDHISNMMQSSNEVDVETLEVLNAASSLKSESKSMSEEINFFIKDVVNK